jgi:hypothetical protein
VRDVDLASLEHENFIDSIAGVARFRPDGLVRRSGGVALLISGVPVRLFNQVLIEDAAAATADDVAAAIATARARAERFVVDLRNGVDDRFMPLMAELGLVRIDGDRGMPGMALRPVPPDAPAPADLTVAVVTDAAGFGDHVVAAAAGFGMPEELAWSFMDVRMLEQPDATFYVGYLEGRPVTTGLGLRTGRTIGVYNISTVESARRRGYGASMTARVAADGRRAGCDVAILQASAMGRPIYERLGYRTVVEYMGYADPEAGGEGG